MAARSTRSLVMRWRWMRSRIGGERDRRRADILVLRQRVARPLPALLGQRVAQFGHRRIVRGAEHVEELALLRLLDDELDRARRQLQEAPTVSRASRRIARIHRLDQEVQEIGDLEIRSPRCCAARRAPPASPPSGRPAAACRARPGSRRAGRPARSAARARPRRPRGTPSPGKPRCRR